MLDVVVPVAIVVLIGVGFWWTRGAGGVPGGTDDPAREELRRFSELADPMPTPGVEQPDREHEIE